MQKIRALMKGLLIKLHLRSPRPAFVDLDDPFLSKEIEGDQPEDVFRHVARWNVEAGARSPTYHILCSILTQAMKDTAVCTHAFQDEVDGLLRMQFYQPVDTAYDEGPWMRMEDWKRLFEESTPLEPDWQQPPRGRMAWVQVYPLNAAVWSDFEELLVALAEASDPERGNRLKIRWQGQMVEAVLERRPTADIRLYFTADRPPIRPKTPAQYAELGLPMPDPQ